MHTENAGGFSNTDWNLYAECYDTLLQLRPYQELLSTVINALKLEDGDRMLDAGCGTGNLLHRLTTLKKKVSLFGVDVSSEMLARAQYKCARQGVAFSQTSLNKKLPFDDATFSKISSVNVLYIVENPAFTLSELWRIAKPGCTVVLVTPKKDYDNGLILKRHAQSSKPDEYWKGVHSSQEKEEKLVREAVADERVVEQMLLVARHNRFISRTATFHFLTKVEFEMVVEGAGFTITSIRDVYADQCMMITATRS